MRSKPYITEEPYVAIVLVAILSAPILGAVLSGCKQKEAPGLTLSKKAQAMAPAARRAGVTTRALDPISRKAKARETVERNRKAARSKVKQPGSVRVNSPGRPQEDVEPGKQVKGPAAGPVESPGKKQLDLPGPGAGGGKAIDKGSSPALRAAKRLIEIFEATEKALPASR